MPITVPAHLTSVYERSHFEDVYRELIAPAVLTAGLEPQAPSSDRTENIQAAIINSLRDADLVLADLSTLNANVFLELGIRTALNLPVCLVSDGTSKLPFDYSTITTHSYDPRPALNLNVEIEQLAGFVRRTVDNSSGRNDLWRFFGSGVELPAAELNPSDVNLDNKIEQLVTRVELLAAAVADLGPRPTHHTHGAASEAVIAAEVSEMLKAALPDGVHGTTIRNRCLRLLGGSYDAVFDGATLGANLVEIGVPTRRDNSGRFYWAGETTLQSGD